MSAPVVYRLYSEDGALLYIGRTNDFETRLRQHLSTTLAPDSRVAGWETIHERYHHHTLEAFPTTAEAKAAEVAAIRAERPLLNVHFNTGRVWKQARVKTRVLDAPGRNLNTRLAYLVGQTMIGAGYSTADLAERADVSPIRLARTLLNGDFVMSDLFAVSAVLGVEASELYREAEQVTA